MVYENTRALGYALVAVSYNITPESRKQGFMLLRGTRARWVSGAEAAFSNVRADLSVGVNQHVTFVRRSNIAGLEQDTQFAQAMASARAEESAEESSGAQPSQQEIDAAQALGKGLGTMIKNLGG